MRPDPGRGSFSIRTRTAYHEAGHAVLSAVMGGRVQRVSIRAAHGTLGRATQSGLASPTALPKVYLAGFARSGLAGRELIVGGAAGGR